MRRYHLVEPAVGQTWSVMAASSHRYEFTIERIGKDVHGTLRCFGRTRSGRPAAIDHRTLRSGLRGAKLVRHTDGSEVSEAPKPTREQLLAEAPSKPRTEKIHRPRGMVFRDELTPEMQRVRELRAEGLSRPQVAERLGAGWNDEKVRRLEEQASDILTMKRLRGAA